MMEYISKYEEFKQTEEKSKKENRYERWKGLKRYDKEEWRKDGEGKKKAEKEKKRGSNGLNNT